VISAKRGWERWQRMQEAATMRPDGHLELDLDARPGDMREGYRRSRQWNLRTLNLMQVGGLVRLRYPSPPARAADEPTHDWASRLDAFYAAVGARLDVELADGQVNQPAGYVSDNSLLDTTARIGTAAASGHSRTAAAARTAAAPAPRSVAATAQHEEPIPSRPSTPGMRSALTHSSTSAPARVG